MSNRCIGPIARAFATIVLGAFLALTATSAMAGPIYTFTVSQGVQPANVGVITLTQNGANSVDVFVDLLPGYGFLNTGGPHTPFAFNLSGSEAGLSIAWTTPANGSYDTNPGVPVVLAVFTLTTINSDNTPYGTYGIGIDSSAGNGSGKAYYGDLLFTLTRVGGLDTADFVRNSDNAPILGGSYFSADLTNGTNTGAQAWAIRTETPDPGPGEVPEPAPLVLFGTALLVFGLVRRRRSRTA